MYRRICCGAYPQYSAIQHETLLLGVKAGVVLLLRLWNHEGSLVLVWVELVAVLARVESLQTVLLQCVDENSLGHLETVVEVLQLLVFGREHLLRHGGESSIQIVDAVDQVLRESLEAKVSCCLNFTFCLFLQVAVLCYRALPFVLRSLSVTYFGGPRSFSYGQIQRLLLLSL